MKTYMNATLDPKKRALHLLEDMSIDEKMGQVNCFLYGHVNFEDFDSLYPFGVGEISLLEMRALNTIDECIEVQHMLQKKAMEQSPHNIPAIFHMEGIVGAYIQGATSFPAGINRGASWDIKLEEEIGKIVACQERALGISHTFAPVLDISRDARLGRQGETYGEDPTLTSALGSAYVKGLQSEDTNGLRSESVAKHFVGFHNSEGGIHGANCQIDQRLLREVYAKPFQAAITNSGLKGIMPSYNTINGEPVSASSGFLTTLLREEMKFDGLVVADYSAINNVHQFQKVCESATEAGLRCMSAGLDVELPIIQAYNIELKQWFKEGKVDIEILNKAVIRVLEAKFRMGLFEQPFALDKKELNKYFYNKKNRDITKKSSDESIVLLKNTGVLPIKKDVKKIAVIGCHANTARAMFGGYTHFSMTEGLMAAKNSMAGVERENTSHNMETYAGSNVQKDDIIPESLIKHISPNAKSLYEELICQFTDTKVTYSYGYPYIGNDESFHNEALETAREADLVIMTLGGKHGTSSIATMGEGVDSTNINLPKCQEDFIEKIAKINKPLIGIHLDGRVISSDVADKYLDGILQAWSPSEAGAESIVDILAGNINPSGKLPLSVAYSSGQIPVYYNHYNGSSWHQGESIGFTNYVDMPHEPRYYFGYGLSYTKYEYSDISISKNDVLPTEKVMISCSVKNIGAMAGDEIVQLYLSDRYASMVRPNMELQGFIRVSLKPGESKKIVFTIHPSQMAFLDQDMKWKVEEGVIDVYIGASSKDLYLKDSFVINKNSYIEGAKRCFYSEAYCDKI